MCEENKIKDLAKITDHLETLDEVIISFNRRYPNVLSDDSVIVKKIKEINDNVTEFGNQSKINSGSNTNFQSVGGSDVTNNPYYCGYYN